MLSPSLITAYFGWTQNLKTRTVPYLHSKFKSPLESSSGIGVLPLFSVYRFHNIANYIRGFARHECSTRTATSPEVTKGFFIVLCLWFAKHARFLKCFIRYSEYECIRTLIDGSALQSLYFRSHMYVTFRLYPLLNASHTYRLAMARVSFAITWSLLTSSYSKLMCLG